MMSNENVIATSDVAELGTADMPKPANPFFKNMRRPKLPGVTIDDKKKHQEVKRLKAKNAKAAKRKQRNK